MNNDTVLSMFDRYADDAFRLAYSYLGSRPDAEGNVIYEGSWKGPEPEVKLMPSDSARFMNYRLTYDPASELAI